MGVELLPGGIRNLYEVHEWKHACAILKGDFPEERRSLRPILWPFWSSQTRRRMKVTPGESLLHLAQAQKFGTVLADPPWRFSNRTGKVAPEHKRLARYQTM